MCAKKKSSIQKLQSPKDEHPIKKIALRFLIYTLLIGGILYKAHDLPIFDPVRKIGEAFTEKRWESYYGFIKKNDPDVLLFGNSLLIHGINPQNFSTALGCNAFILAGPGTFYKDQFYCLKEAIKAKKPKLVIFETFGLKEGSARSATFKSFEARKDFQTKLFSTPFIYDINDYVYAWSNAVRNHSNLYDYDPIPPNDLNTINGIRARKDLYLGRYICFTEGIDDANYAKIKKDGAYYNTSINVNSTIKKYVKSIIDLCQENDIQLMFLTIPMFDEALKNREDRDHTLANLLEGQTWLNLQDPINYKGFSRESFQNCYKCVNHMTYKGSLLATYKLVDYISNHHQLKLPNRKSNATWYQTFYKKDGFFENNLPSANDKENKNLYQGQPNDLISNILQINFKDHYKIIAKIKPNHSYPLEALKHKKLQLSIEATYKGKTEIFNMLLNYDQYHSYSKNVIFNIAIDKMDIIAIKNVAFI